MDELCSKRDATNHEFQRRRVGGCASYASADEENYGDLAGETSAAARLRQSRILSRWVARQAEQIVITTLEESRSRESELLALARLHTVSMLDASFLRESRAATTTAPDEQLDSAARASAVLQRWRELEGQASDSSRSSSREPSQELGEAERARVRQIARGWMAETNNGIATSESTISQSSPRSEWLGETERERVRLVRELMQMASQGEEQREDEGMERRRREMPRLRGRQARADVVMRMARERQSELQGLSEHRAVSSFAHRSRIQVEQCIYASILSFIVQRIIWDVIGVR